MARRDLQSAIKEFSGLTAEETKRRILARQNGGTGEFKEEDHPRDSDGKFTYKGGGSSGGSHKDGEVQGSFAGEKQAQGSAKNSDKIETCTTHAELGEYFSKTYGVTIDSSVYSLDFPAVHSAAAGVDIVFREFPQVKGALKTIRAEVLPSNYLMAATFDGVIELNALHFVNGSATVQAAMEKASKDGFRPKNNGVRECAAHEMGHILDAAICRKKYGDFSGESSWSSGYEAFGIIDDALMKVWSYDNRTSGEITKEVSEYAYKGGSSETLAECVGDYIANGENASPLSREVWKILKKEMR